MAADYTSRVNVEDARVAREQGEAAAALDAAASRKREAAAAMRASIDAHVKARVVSAVGAERAARAEAAAEHAAFKAKLAALEESEAADAAARRGRAAELQRTHLAQMADKKRTAVLWGAVDTTDAARADAAATGGGPLEGRFRDQAAAIEERMRERGVPVRSLHRKVNALLHPPFASNSIRL